MKTYFALTHSGNIIVIIDSIDSKISEINSILNVVSLGDYINHKDNLEESMNNGKIISTKTFVKQDIVTFLKNPSDIKKYINKTINELHKHFTDRYLKNKKTRTYYSYSNKNLLELSLTDTQSIIKSTEYIQYLRLTNYKYCVQDSVVHGTSIFYDDYDEVILKSLDLLNSIYLFEIAKFCGHDVTFKQINELFFDNEIQFTTIAEIE